MSRLAPLSEVPDRGTLAVSHDGEPILLCRFGEHLLAYAGRCPHRGAPLADGTVEGAMLRCPWHQALFDLRTGERVHGPDCDDLTPVAVTAVDRVIHAAEEART